MPRERFSDKNDRGAGKDIQILLRFERRAEKIGKDIVRLGLPVETARRLERVLFDTAVELRDIVSEIRKSDKLLVYYPPYFKLSGVDSDGFAIRCLDGNGFLDFFEGEELSSVNPEQIITSIELSSEYELGNARAVKNYLVRKDHERPGYPEGFGEDAE